MDTVVLNGFASDTDGTIASYLWTMVSFPGAANIVSPNATTSVVSGMTAGIYVFRLTVVDNDGLEAHDDVQVTVNPSITPTTGTVKGGQPNVAISTATIPFQDAGVTNINTSIVYEIGSVLKSYVPGRTINAITGFITGRGYYIVAKADFDLTNFISTPAI
jgi:K319-like protein